MTTKGELGLLVGHTRTGKEIYCHLPDQGPIDRINSRNLDFDDNDLLDAFAVFEHIAINELRLTGDSRSQSYFEAQAKLFFHMLSVDGKFESVKKRANVKTSIEIRELGRFLASGAFA